ncbi:putative nicotinamide N-methyltransferase [Aspergillus clavatus NRRL 1]|uniref:Nicotinamide N-methyltransferase n=1 Tax=Aspergillus clavatus (strain ATCC 1007 / CBS 513.65 / DSM 816 / NCTC 3887 / NRRL 1 / QM 1276 / 107) TaxID=344612 RepID=A1CF58_ASPCL|nr:uncharacterized protein ACLA_092050 [Aspergillus clavatus NRRL 1]EAW11507.1 conserved hypothetical protein [Aspergillus clavatus NRRL 1]
MLHSRLRPLPRRHAPLHQSSSPSSTAPAPDFQDQDDLEVEESPEDIFTAFLPHLFPDDAPSFHGDPGQHLLYSSPRYGNLDIMVPSYPSQSEKRTEEIAAGLPQDGKVNQVEEGRKLFAHFLWSAAMVVAEGVENADTSSVDSDTAMWQVKGESVLELGAGAGLPSLISALAQASRVTVTDHPASPAFAGALRFNMSHNIPKTISTDVSIEPHEWGVLDDPFALQNKGAFTRIIAADCYWMPSQHENLVRTMLWFLAPGGRVWVVAGFHTGRTIVAGFFETAVKNGLEIERIHERDLNSTTEDGKEVRREWMPVREGEAPENRKRWCVVALLKRAQENET